MPKDDFNKNINSEKNFKQMTDKIIVRNIQKREGFYFFYAGVDPELKPDYRPYELVKVVNKKDPAVARLAVLESHKNLKGLQLSEILAHNLKLKVGDEVLLQSVQNVPGVDSINVTKISSSTPPIIEDTPIDYLKDYDSPELYYNQKTERYSQENKKDLLDYVKKTFRYSYLTDNHEFCYKNMWYRISLVQSKIKHFLILPTTKINFITDPEILGSEDIIGLEEPYQTLKQCITWPNHYADYYDSLKIDPPKGILLTGPPGCGKTYLMREISKNTNLYFIHIKGPEIVSKYVGGSEKELRRIFELAKKNEPALIFFDEIDAIGGKRSSNSETESRVVAQLLTLMDGIEARGNVIVVAATNQPDVLDPALRRPGRFDKQIVVKLPNLSDRKKLFRLFMKNVEHDPRIDLDVLAERTPGFAQADIKYLVNESKMNVVRRLEKDSSDRNKLNMADFEAGIRNMDPAALRQYYVLKDAKKTLDQIIGYQEVKKKIFEEIYLPKKYPNLFRNHNLKRIKGVLLQGPPGTGKTSLAKALASELNYNFLTIVASDITSKYVGEPEQRIRQLFKKASLSAPCIIFLDEIDAIFGSSDKLKNLAAHDISKTGQLLAEMDGALTNDAELILIGTTNKTRLLDPALLRPGRFELVLTMDYPSKDELKQLYQHYFKDMTDITDYSSLLQKSRKHGLTGADVELIKKTTVFNYFRDKSPTTLKDLEDSSENKILKLGVTLQDIDVALNQVIKGRQSMKLPLDLSN